MKAIRYHETGPAEVLRLEDVPEPSAGEGQLLVKVAAAGINYAEVGRRSGHLPHTPGQSLPLIPGLEAAGTVAAVGSGVTSFALGDRVAVRANGSYAEYVAVPASAAYRIPHSLDLIEAATVLTTYTTAWSCLVTRGKLQPGETVLIQAAASGVAIAVVQLAKHLGATVIGTASTDAKLEWARGHGLDHGINYSTHDFVDAVKQLTGGKGVQMVVDGVGGDVFLKGLKALERGGRMVVYGVASGQRTAEITLPELWFQNLTIMGGGGGSVSPAEVGRMLALFDDGVFHPTVDRTWPLAQAAEAHRYIEDRKVRGKVALTMD